MSYTVSYKNAEGKWVTVVHEDYGGLTSDQKANIQSTEASGGIVKVIPYSSSSSSGSSGGGGGGSADYSEALNTSSSQKQYNQKVNQKKSNNNSKPKAVDTNIADATPQQKKLAQSIASKVNKETLQQRYAQAVKSGLPLQVQLYDLALHYQYQQNLKGAEQFAKNQGFSQQQTQQYVNTAATRLAKSYTQGTNAALQQALLNKTILSNSQSSTSHNTQIQAKLLHNNPTVKSNLIGQPQTFFQNNPNLQKSFINRNRNNIVNLVKTNTPYFSNSLSTNFVLNHSVSGLNPVSRYVMQKSAVNSDLKRLQNKSFAQPIASRLNQQLQFQVNQTNRDVSQINAINKQINATSMHTSQGGVVNQIKQSYTTPPSFSTIGIPVSKSTISSVNKFENKLKPFGMINNPLTTGAIEVGLDFAKGVKQVVESPFILGAALYSNVKNSVMKNGGGVIGSIKGVGEGLLKTGETAALGTATYLATLPANLVKKPFQIAGNVVAGVGVSKAFNTVDDKLTLTKTALARKSLQEMAKKQTTNIFPRLKENFGLGGPGENPDLYVNSRGNIAVKGVKIQKSNYDVDNTYGDTFREYFKPNSATDFPTVKGKPVRPVEVKELLSSKPNIRFYKSDMKTKLGDTRVTHTVKPSNVVDYTTSNSKYFGKGTITIQDNGASVGSEFGSVKVGNKIVQVKKQFSINPINKQNKITQTITLSLKNKPFFKKTISFRKMSENPELLYSFNPPTIITEQTDQYIQQKGLKIKAYAGKNSKYGATTSVTQDTVLKPGKEMIYDRKYGQKLSEKTIPGKLQVGKNGKAGIVSEHSVKLNERNPDIVKVNIQPRTSTFKNIVTKVRGKQIASGSNGVAIQTENSLTKIAGAVKGFNSLVSKALNSKKAMEQIVIAKVDAVTKEGGLYSIAKTKVRQMSIPNVVNKIEQSLAGMKVPSISTPKVEPGFTALALSKNMQTQTSNLKPTNYALSFTTPAPVVSSTISSTTSLSKITPETSIAHTNNNSIDNSYDQLKTISKEVRKQPNTEVSINSAKLSFNKNEIKPILQTTTNIPSRIPQTTQPMQEGNIEETIVFNPFVKSGEKAKETQQTITRNIPATTVKPISILKPKQETVTRIKQIPKTKVRVIPWLKTQPITITKQKTALKQNPPIPTNPSPFLKIPMFNPFLKLPAKTSGMKPPIFGGFKGLANKKSIKSNIKYNKKQNLYPFAGLLNINIMDAKLNKQNKSPSLQIALQPKKWQMKQWKPYFNPMTTSLPTYRMLLKPKKYKPKKVRLW